MQMKKEKQVDQIQKKNIKNLQDKLSQKQRDENNKIKFRFRFKQ